MFIAQETRPATGMKELIEQLYEPAFFRVAKHVSKAGGSFEEAKDVFHDSLEVFFEKKQSCKPIDSDVDYLVGIARHLWAKRARGDARFLSVDRFDTSESITITVDEKKLLTLLEHTGKRCLDLLVSFYYDKVSVAKLMNKFGFKSEHSASVQKYKCIEKLREVVKSKSLDYADFFE